MLKPGKYRLEAFQIGPGKTPYQDWLQSLDKRTRVRIVDRVGRLEKGHFGDYKKIDQSLYELRFFFGFSVQVIEFISEIIAER